MQADPADHRPTVAATRRNEEHAQPPPPTPRRGPNPPGRNPTRLTTDPPSPRLAGMRSTLSPSRRSHSRRLAPQVQRPRLRPSWRIALTIVAAAAALTATLMLVDRVGR